MNFWVSEIFQKNLKNVCCSILNEGLIKAIKTFNDIKSLRIEIVLISTIECLYLFFKFLLVFWKILDTKISSKGPSI